jgi:hypothetical protein
MTSNWNAPLLAQQTSLPFAHLVAHFDLLQFNQWPNATGLNRLKKHYVTETSLCPDFVCQSQLTQSDEYYEQYIYKYKQVPTRPDSWHDLFNGLIWLQFPKSKAVINQQHMEDINHFGLSPRSSRRNNLTHFDECGVVLAVEAEPSDSQVGQPIQMAIPKLLREHQWHSVFVSQRPLWGCKIHSFVFGHANLEMLLQPFIGLTGKWISVDVPSGFGTLPRAQQLCLLDNKLANMINQSNVFQHKYCLYPMPLLGIPGLTDENKDPDYYANSDYFRPVSKNNRK